MVLDDKFMAQDWWILTRTLPADWFDGHLQLITHKLFDSTQQKYPQNLHNFPQYQFALAMWSEARYLRGYLGLSAEMVLHTT